MSGNKKRKDKGNGKDKSQTVPEKIPYGGDETQKGRNLMIVPLWMEQRRGLQGTSLMI